METENQTPAIEETQVETTEVVETTQVETTQATPETEVVETASEAPKAWYAEFGYDNDEAVKNDFTAFKTKVEEFTQKETEISERMKLLEEVENPIPDEFKEVIAIAKSAGIKDLSTVTAVISMNEETAKSNPLSALVLDMQVNNPSKFKALGGKEGAEEYFREKYNLSSEGEYVPSKVMIADAHEAFQGIENIKKNVKVDENPFTFAKANKASQQEAAQKRSEATLSELETFTKSMAKIDYKYGEKSVSLNVKQEEVQSLLESAKSVAHLIDTSTKEGKQALSNWASDQVLLSKVRSGELAIEIEKSIKAQATKEAVQEVHNGQPKTINRTEKTNQEAPKSVFAEVAQNRGLGVQQ